MSIIVLSAESALEVQTDVTTSLDGKFSGETVRVAPFSQFPSLLGRQLKHKLFCLQQTQFLQRPERLQRQQLREETRQGFPVLWELDAIINHVIEAS